MKIFTFIILFAAVCSISWLLLGTIRNYLFERFSKDKSSKKTELAKMIAPEKLLQYRILLGSVLFSVVIVVLLFANVFNPILLCLLSVVGAFIGYQLPYVYFMMKFRKRQQEIEDKLLNFVMALTNGLKSGMAFGQSLDAVTKHSTGPIKEEFQQVIREQRLGLDMTEALERLEERVPCEDMQLFVTTVKLTTKTGGSMVEVLSEMVATMRQRKEFSDKLRTMTAEGRFQALAISLSPLAGFLLLSLVNRELMKPLVTTGLGWGAIGVICVLISIGYFFINKIMSIEV